VGAGRQPARRFGPALAAQGGAWVGALVLRFWPDQGGWWEAQVGGWSDARQKHKLVYDAGSENVRRRGPSPGQHTCNTRLMHAHMGSRPCHQKGSAPFG
jgi:hypothetical protein